MQTISERAHPLDAVTPEKFAALIGKTEKAIKVMIQENKLPVVTMQNPENPNPQRAQKLVYLPEFNRAMREAFNNRPKEQRDAWLLWLGL